MTDFNVLKRREMLDARLVLGDTTIELADYAATGLLAMAVAPRGKGKTNAALNIVEQLSAQGWVAVIVDPESELAGLYQGAVADPAALRERLERRDVPINVVRARDAGEFVPYAQVIMEAADTWRKPMIVMIDEGQLFSSSRQRKGAIGDASQLLNDFAGRGRKRALDMVITALRPSNSVSRDLFGNRNLTLIGGQDDAADWQALGAQCRSARLTFADFNALGPGEFYCFSRRGVDRVRLPLAQALHGAALKARPIVRALPATFNQWQKALAAIPAPRLGALSDPVVDLLATVAGLSAQQVQAGRQALRDELEFRK
jgi:hypothetical protein